jgi:hypothetical protein
MGGLLVDPEEPTQSAGVAEDETQSARAWGLADEYDERHMTQRLSARVVTASAIVASLVAVVGAAVVVGYHLHDDAPSPVDGNPAAGPVTTTLSRVAAPPQLSPPPHTPPAASAPPSPVTVRVRPPVANPRPIAPAFYTTWVSWVGAPCIDIRFPDGNSTPVETSCDATRVQILHHRVVNSGDLIGADPIMGQAAGIACRVVSDATQAILVADSGSAGDGHDINCMLGAP